MITTAGYVGIAIGVIAASIPAGMGAEIGKRIITPIIDRWQGNTTEALKNLRNNFMKGVNDFKDEQKKGQGKSWIN